MNYCKKCVMPDTRPGITFDNEGICSACRHAEAKEKIDWEKRKEEFQKLCDSYKRETPGEYDCIIAVSSGKDSYFQIHTIKEHGLNPLLVSVNNLDWTNTGKYNFKNMLDVFDCDCIVHKSSTKLNRIISRLIFEHDGFIAWLFDRLIYTYPLHIATKFNIPLIFYGENINVEYGGKYNKETPLAHEQLKNDVVRDYEWEIFENTGITRDQLVLAEPPKDSQLQKLDPRYLSYYFKWSGYEHMELAKQYGWKSLNDTGEWVREGYIEDYDQIDDFAYCVDPWLKYPKYGHARATDVASYWIREGRITREEGIQLVKENDHKLDTTALVNYLEFSDYSSSQFYRILDKFYNREIFEETASGWKIKDPIWLQV